jgi:hypothetical protein
LIPAGTGWAGKDRVMSDGWTGTVPDVNEIAMLDTGVPHIARVYDYCLGGKDNFAADREAAKEFIWPGRL